MASEQEASESLSKRELDEASAELRAAAVWYRAAKQSGMEALVMTKTERLLDAADRYGAAVEQRTREVIR